MDVKLRYVTSRPGKQGEVRWYWQRKGFKLTRLPADPVKRFAEAEKLNAAADAKTAAQPSLAKGQLVEGSIAWVIQKYRDSDEYKVLAKGTTKYYARNLADIEDLGPTLAFSALDRRMVVDFIETFTGSRPRQVAAVLKNLFKIAMYYGHATANHAHGLRLTRSKSRKEWWTDEDEAAWLKAADQHPHGPDVRVAFVLLINTAQRPGDVLKMTMPQYNGETIKLRQEKTGTLIEVPCPAQLRAVLDPMKLDRRRMRIVTNGGKPMSYGRFAEYFRDITDKAGLRHLQARDLRRTAMLRMALAGATTPQIASVSGHSIESTQQILDTYLPRNVGLAREAIIKLETARERKV